LASARFSANVKSELLETFSQLIAEQKIKVTVASRFPLKDAGRAQELSQSGHGRGRIVLHIAD